MVPRVTVVLQVPLILSVTCIDRDDDDVVTEGEEADSGGDVCVSATRGSGLFELQMQVQREVLRATGQTFWEVELPASGPHLR